MVMNLQDVVLVNFKGASTSEVTELARLLVEHIYISALSEMPEEKVQLLISRLDPKKLQNIDDFFELFARLFPDQSDRLEVYIQQFMDNYAK